MKILAFLFAVLAGAAHADVEMITGDQRHCLREAVYFEARNQGPAGMEAVAWVVLNRVDHKNWPDTICGVTNQRGKKTCAFSYECDGKPETVSSNPIEQAAWQTAKEIANLALIDWSKGKAGPVDGAIKFHADYVNPSWASKYQVVKQIKDHIFYKINS